MHCSEVDETATGSANFFGPRRRIPLEPGRGFA
jgi:hypothetical protein